jgi:monoamine oxidase
MRQKPTLSIKRGAVILQAHNHIQRFPSEYLFQPELKADMKKSSTSPSSNKAHSKNQIYDVIIIGAGVAGLACAYELLKNNLKVLIIEGRNRIGGRILTSDQNPDRYPIELGAEFVHGAPASTFQFLNQFGLGFYDCCDEHLYLKHSQLKSTPDFWEQIQEIMDKLDARRKKDRSVAEFIKTLPKKYSREIVTLFQAFVEGFHSADISNISEKGLAESEQSAEAELNGSSLFRLRQGYDLLPQRILQSFSEPNQALRLNTTVKRLHWQKGHCRLSLHSESGLPQEQIISRKVIITIPIGVLCSEPQSPAHLLIDPYPKEMQKALESMKMGNVQRITFHFRTRFWEELSSKPVGFLHAGPEKFFPTWWTMMPMRTPFLIAWQGGPKALELSRRPEAERVQLALSTLSSLSGHSLDFLSEQLQGWHTHDWTRDPFSQGAYSYLLVDGVEASHRLTRPFDDTLYFAGEGTAASSARGTVHGALDSGFRAAQQILK